MGAMIKRDLRLFALRGSEGMATLAFFFIVITLFGVAVADDQVLLGQLGAVVIWIAGLLAALLSLEPLYHRDGVDGTFELLLVRGIPSLKIAGAKMMTHWLIAGAPLVVSAVLAAEMLQVFQTGILVLSLLLGTLYLSLLGGFGAMLTLGSRRAGVLQALIVLPLSLPMMLLGLGASQAALAGLSASPYLLLQLALLIPAAILLPLAAGAVMQMHIRN